MKDFRRQLPRPKKNTLIIGREAVIRAMNEGRQLEKIWLQSSIHGPMVEEIKSVAAAHLVPVNKVPVEKLNSFNISNHEGCVAQISKIQYQDLQQVISFIVDSGEVPLFLMLDGITDIRNIGAIARSSFCFGVNAIIIPEKGVGALNEDAILTSAGALEHIAVCRVNNLIKTINDLHLNGIKILGGETSAGKNIFDCDFSEPVAIVIGGEEKGISPVVMKACDESFRIPMTGSFDSLNVSVAAGIALYEAMKQRGFKK